MPDDQTLRLNVSLTVNLADIDPSVRATGSVQAAVSFTYVADGICCDGELSLRVFVDD